MKLILLTMVIISMAVTIFFYKTDNRFMDEAALVSMVLALINFSYILISQEGL